MGKRAFTPGPWWIGDPNCRLDGTREKGIHTVDYIIADMNADAGTDARQAADARLIAAAPDMYGVLDEAMDLVPRVSEDDPMAPALAEWCAKARAVLANAVAPV